MQRTEPIRIVLWEVRKLGEGETVGWGESCGAGDPSVAQRARSLRMTNAGDPSVAQRVLAR